MEKCLKRFCHRRHGVPTSFLQQHRVNRIVMRIHFCRFSCRACRSCIFVCSAVALLPEDYSCHFVVIPHHSLSLPCLLPPSRFNSLFVQPEVTAAFSSHLPFFETVKVFTCMHLLQASLLSHLRASPF